MDFSESYRCSGPATYSPDGRYLATAVEYRLLIRDVESLRLVQLFTCLDRIDTIAWSATSAYVLCGLFSRATVQVWCVEQPEWTCKIDEGPAGVSAVRWSPDGVSIIVVADFGIRTTIWSLADRKCTYIRGPKFADRGLVFSPDGSHLAVLERVQCKDRVSVYDTSSWQLLHSFQAVTQDAAELSWSPDGCHLALLDNPLNYRLAVYTPDGQTVANFCAYSGMLGIKSGAWSSSGQLLALGSHDQAVRVLNNISWEPLLEFGHPSHITSPAATSAYIEVEDEQSRAGASMPGTPNGTPARSLGGAGSSSRSKYIIRDLPLTVPSAKPQGDQASQLGVGLLSWSPGSAWLATVNGASPGTVWLLDMAAMELGALVVHGAPVKAMAWAPQGATLAIVTGTTKLHLWTPEGASVVHLPLQSFQAHGVTWSCTGSSLVLQDKGAFCCAYLAGSGADGDEPPEEPGNVPD